MAKTRFITGILSGIFLVAHADAQTHVQTQAELERDFKETVRPFLSAYCITCHGGDKPKGQLTLEAYSNIDSVVKEFPNWSRVRERLVAREMPPGDAVDNPTAQKRQHIIDWIDSVRKEESVRRAGDPGIVIARRLSNAEFDYTVRDLTGVDIRPTREFPADPSNPAGFDNSGESLAMSPELLQKQLKAAHEVADHMFLKPDGFDFSPTTMLAETDRDLMPRRYS